jgi:hypothetical protein
VLLEIDQDRPVVAALPPGPVVHTEHTDEPNRRQRRSPHQAQQRASADWCSFGLGAPRTEISAKGEGLTLQVLVQTDGPPSPGRREVGQALTEDALPTPGHSTPETTCLHVQRDDSAGAWHVGKGSLVLALDAPGAPPTGRAACPRAGRGHHQMKRVYAPPQAINSHPDDIGKEQLGKHSPNAPVSRTTRL